MKFQKSWITIIGLLCALMLLVPQVYAGDEGGVKIGTLTVKRIPGTGHNLIINSSVDVDAVFTDDAGNTEHYIGEMGIGLGIDFSYKKAEEFGYVVFSPSSAYKTGSYALQGKYFGADASATVIGGVAVKVMVGGFDKSFTLQPLALGVNKGVGASAGVGYLFLQKDHTK
jgi:hypothetical protein